MDVSLARDGARAGESLAAHLQMTADVVLEAIRNDQTMRKWFTDLQIMATR
ncbi:hypothetical protein M2323_004022 [Rhodoblastus acidophilus]|uniref:hypothetical protein n=1 Tax=Rhodoblastus acidophilus TaxID=1074 RepID=UPI00222585D4|nr:hypothetical protein [Rhodoblastus acidophilus]MCW2286184.1 hypothetical protein [Rhodoblastus acidophilus]MCW2335078.1 hypothetical protein [Rhodoblastus acidophilus]